MKCKALLALLAASHDDAQLRLVSVLKIIYSYRFSRVANVHIVERIQQALMTSQHMFS